MARAMIQPAIARIRDRAADIAHAENELLSAMWTVYSFGGFSALHAMTERLKADIARKNARALAGEGWVA
jgi:hypothetical protein